MIFDGAQNDLPVYLYQQGKNYQAHDIFGCHFDIENNCAVFRVWAPNALEVSVAGDWNNWDEKAHRMDKVSDRGVWETVIREAKPADKYKYSILGQDDKRRLKADPFAFRSETGGKTASIVCDLSGYEWRDDAWVMKRRGKGYLGDPINIYEIHAGSWRRHTDGKPLTYAGLADEVASYAADMGYTHIELLPVMEHHSERTWGYQSSGFFAATSRYGAPGELMEFIDRCHEAGIGVILDWTPSCFPNGESGLELFDGTPLFESPGQRAAENREWGTSQFDFSKPEVHSFLISSAVFWLETYHADGLRVDGISRMLWLDYERKSGDWTANAYGGNENLEAVDFLQKLNREITSRGGGALMIAEDDTSWPMVTKAVNEGGLGFRLTWNTRWTGDMLEYISVDPLYRKMVHDKITSSIYYAFNENYILPVPHGRVARGSRSLIDRMPGGYEQKFAGLRAFMGFMISHPGKKLNFMGNEIGQFNEWDCKSSVEWGLLDFPAHKQLQEYNKALNRLYLETPAFWENDQNWDGFQWISADDSAQNIIVFIRTDKNDNSVIVLQNFAPVKREEYRFGIPEKGAYKEFFNSDSAAFGGWGNENAILNSEETPMHGFPRSLQVAVPPLATVFFRRLA